MIPSQGNSVFRLGRVLVAGLCFGVLGFGILAAQAGAQSLLSPRSAAGSPGLPPAVLAPLITDPGALIEWVDKGETAQAYPLLRRQAAHLEQQPPADDEWSERYRKVLLYLLKSGENHAPPDEQERNARIFVDRFPDDTGFPQAFFFLNQALYQQGKPLETSFFFDDDALATLNQPMQLRYHQMRARSAARQGRPLQAAESLMAYLQREDSPEDGIRQEILDQLSRLTKPGELEQFYQAHPDAGWLEDELPYLHVQIVINRGQLADALMKVEKLQRESFWPSASTVKKLRAFRREIETTLATVPRRIGVLLPLGSSSSALRRLAFQTLDGLRLAVQFDGQTPAPSQESNRRWRRPSLDRLRLRDHVAGTPGARSGRVRQGSIELVIRDTKNNPRETRRLVKSLVEEDKVVAIVGPIARTESEAAASAALVLKVPLISLSVSMEIPAESGYIFRHSKSPEEEIRHLVGFALDYLHAKRFTILHPQSSYGATMMRMFWREVEARGGKVIGVASFKRTTGSAEPVDLKAIFEEMTGLKRPLAPEEQALLEAVGDRAPDPIVDFDAIFVPLGPNGQNDLRIIASYPVTVDAEDVLILGTRFWNTQSMLVAAEGKIKSALFVDVYDRTGNLESLTRFRNQHFLFFGHRNNYQAPSYYAAAGYDTVNILKMLIRKGKIRSRKALARALSEMDPYEGVTGLTSFLATGESIKESMFFRLEGTTLRRMIP